MLNLNPIVTITANQLVAHMVGDYLLQSDWMALEKTKKNIAAAAHAVTYTIAFLPFVDASFEAFALIALTHFVVDRWRLARYVVYAKNFLATKEYWYDWESCQGTGYHSGRPAWMTVWLMIIADNTLHVIGNAIILQWF